MLTNASDSIRDTVSLSRSQQRSLRGALLPSGPRQQGQQWRQGDQDHHRHLHRGARVRGLGHHAGRGVPA